MRKLVLLSGGLDSAVALAVSEPDVAQLLTVDYGQRHAGREIAAAREVADYYEKPHTVVRLDPVLFAGSALTDASMPLPGSPAHVPDSTYVPARNTVLLALGAAFAESHECSQVVIGANRDDAGGYPDCRPRYLDSFRDVLMEGTVNHVWVAAPLIGMTKAQVLAVAREYCVPVELTWSCYAGGEVPCGVCGACLIRREAIRGEQRVDG